MTNELQAAHAAMERAVWRVGHLARSVVAQYTPGHPPPEHALDALKSGVVALAATEESYWALIRREVGR